MGVDELGDDRKTCFDLSILSEDPGDLEGVHIERRLKIIVRYRKVDQRFWMMSIVLPTFHSKVKKGGRKLSGICYP